MAEDLKNIEFLIRDLRADNYNNTFIKSLEHLIKSYKELEYKYNKAVDSLVEADHENLEVQKRLKEIRDKAECQDYYTLSDVINDLTELLGDDK